MKAVVTGAAGFIGSHLAELLLREGHAVVGLDAITGYYPRERKLASLAAVRESARFDFREVDLAVAPLDEHLVDADVVFHLAGEPGVRASWGQGFANYVRNNVVATQRVLEAVVTCDTPRVVFASSSSIYGQRRADQAADMCEDDVPSPVSPYGTTKLAAEHLVRAYAESHGFVAVALRYFTVYGMRQRPDMAFHRLVKAAREGVSFPLYGDGTQIRDYTHVTDVVRATYAAASIEPLSAYAMNIAGGSQATLLECIEIVESAVGRKIPIDHRGPARGDVTRTAASTALAQSQLGWRPEVPLADGLGEYALGGP